MDDDDRPAVAVMESFSPSRMDTDTLRPLSDLRRRMPGLDENFFRVRIARCTRAELEYLQAMAALGSGPYRSGDIATRLGRPGPQNVAPLRARLIEKGPIYSPSHGLSEFSVPQFADFMRRATPAIR